MDARNLFQLGTTDLGSGAAQTEGSPRTRVDDNVLRFSREEEQAETRDVALTPNSDDVPRGNTDNDHFIRRGGDVFAGTHLIIEVIDGEGLDDQDRIETAFRDCVANCGATLLSVHLHRFSPQGVSGVAILAESHISAHTWPEHGYGAFDVFMCGDADPHRAVEVLRAAFNARDVQVTELRRGLGVV